MAGKIKVLTFFVLGNAGVIASRKFALPPNFQFDNGRISLHCRNILWTFFLNMKTFRL